MPLRHSFGGSQPSTRRGSSDSEFHDSQRILNEQIAARVRQAAMVVLAREQRQQRATSPPDLTMSERITQIFRRPRFYRIPTEPLESSGTPDTAWQDHSDPDEEPIISRVAGTASATLQDSHKQPPPAYSETMGMYLWSTASELRKMPNPDEFIRRRRDDPPQDDYILDRTGLESPWPLSSPSSMSSFMRTETPLTIRAPESPSTLVSSDYHSESPGRHTIVAGQSESSTTVPTASDYFSQHIDPTSNADSPPISFEEIPRFTAQNYQREAREYACRLEGYCLQVVAIRTAQGIIGELYNFQSWITTFAGMRNELYAATTIAELLLRIGDLLRDADDVRVSQFWATFRARDFARILTSQGFDAEREVWGPIMKLHLGVTPEEIMFAA